MSTLTHSRQSSYRTCPRRHYLRFELALSREAKPSYLCIGSAFHAAVDARAKGEPLPPALDDMDPHDMAVAAAMVQVHDELQPPLDMVASELVFKLPLRNRRTGRQSTLWTWEGVIDGIAELPGGRLALVERKTTSRDVSPGGDYWLQVMRDQQISQYVMAARQEGWDVTTVLYDVVRRPMHQRRRATPEADLTYNRPAVEFSKIEKHGDGTKTFSVSVNGEAAGNAVTVDGEWFIKSLWLNGNEQDVGHLGPLLTEAKKAIKDQIAEHVTGPLHARHRLLDETPEEYTVRLADLMREDPEKYLQRIEIPRLQSELDATLDDQWTLQKAIRGAQRSGEWPRNPDACVTPYRCAYVDICDRTDLETTVPEGFVRVDNLHPELNQEGR